MREFPINSIYTNPNKNFDVLYAHTNTKPSTDWHRKNLRSYSTTALINFNILKMIQYAMPSREREIDNEITRQIITNNTSHLVSVTIFRPLSCYLLEQYIIRS